MTATIAYRLQTVVYRYAAIITAAYDSPAHIHRIYLLASLSHDKHRRQKPQLWVNWAEASARCPVPCALCRVPRSCHIHERRLRLLRLGNQSLSQAARVPPACQPSAHCTVDTRCSNCRGLDLHHVFISVGQCATHVAYIRCHITCRWL